MDLMFGFLFNILLAIMYKIYISESDSKFKKNYRRNEIKLLSIKVHAFAI